MLQSVKPTRDRKRLAFCTHSYKVVREQTSPAVDLSLPPASILLPDVGDDLTHADGQLIVVLGLVVKLHYGLHCNEQGQKGTLEIRFGEVRGPASP